LRARAYETAPGRGACPRDGAGPGPVPRAARRAPAARRRRASAVPGGRAAREAPLPEGV